MPISSLNIDLNDLTTAWIILVSKSCCRALPKFHLPWAVPTGFPPRDCGPWLSTFTAEAAQLQDHHTLPVCIAWGQITTGHTFHWQRQIASGMPMWSLLSDLQQGGKQWFHNSDTGMRQSRVFQQKTVDEHANVGYIMLSLSIDIYIYSIQMYTTFCSFFGCWAAC